jgi:hypothetical protein
MSDFTHAAGTVERLKEIDDKLALAENELAEAARGWYVTGKPAREAEEARAFAAGFGTTVERKFDADAAGAVVGCEEEARWETLVRVVRILECRASIGQSVLRVGRT